MVRVVCLLGSSGGKGKSQFSVLCWILVKFDLAGSKELEKNNGTRLWHSGIFSRRMLRLKTRFLQKAPFLTGYTLLSQASGQTA